MDGMGLGTGISLVTMVLTFVVPFFIFRVVFRRLGLSQARHSLFGSFWGRIGFQWRLLWWLLICGFIGLMIATAGGAIYPPVVQPAAQLLCDGEVSMKSQGYSYKPGQRGVAHTITCAEANGDQREITFQSVFFAAALYGAALFVLRLLWWLLRGRGDAPEPDAATGLSPSGAFGSPSRPGGNDLGKALQGLSGVLGSAVATQIQEALNKAHGGHANVTINGREVPMNDAIGQRLADALQKASSGKGVTVNSTTVNGQPMGDLPASDTATRLQQLKQLRDRGLISAAEFDAKRAEILRAL
mgnify:CR=1 FL=1